MGPNTWLALIAAVALTAAPAVAEPPAAALTAYAQGEYLTAASRAEAQPSAASQVLAARALIAASMTDPHARHVGAWLNRAEEAAEEALRLEPNSVEARLQLAFTIGAKARRAALAEALARNYAPRGRRLIQEAIARAPDNAQAHALLGGWHLEVLRRGGATGARMYGARLETGLAEFERARVLAPHNMLIAVQFGVALLQLDPDRFSARAADLLAVQSASADALESYAATQAQRIVTTLRTRGPRAAQAAAREAFL